MRFRLDTECIIDMAENKVLSLAQVRNTLNRLNDENMELKERNQRQAERLDRLYGLIEAKDWRTLSDILDDFKRCEEQIQQEECTYAR